MKASFLAVAVFWAGAALAQAPDPAAGGPGGHHESPQQRLDHLAILLDLTAAQKTQVGAILEEQHSKLQAQREQAQASGTKPTFEQMKAEHQQMQQDLLTQLSSVLSATQVEKFKVLMAERGPPGGGPH